MSDVAFLSAPGAGVVAVTPSNSTVLVGVRGLYIGGAGDVAVTMADGSTGTFSTVPQSTILPIQCTKVTTATTATLILAII